MSKTTDIHDIIFWSFFIVPQPLICGQNVCIVMTWGRYLTNIWVEGLKP